jgi:hypothetical protein
LARADDELYPGEIGEGASAGDGAVPCRVLTNDELRRMADRVMVFVKETDGGGCLFVVSGTLDGRSVKDALYRGRPGERYVAHMPAGCASTEEWLEKYAPPWARAARRGSRNE